MIKGEHFTEALRRYRETAVLSGEALRQDPSGEASHDMLVQVYDLDGEAMYFALESICQQELGRTGGEIPQEIINGLMACMFTGIQAARAERG